MKRKTFNNQFCSWFTGTVFCDIKHPYYGKHQLTPYQIKMSSGEYKNKLWSNITDCFDIGYLTEEKYLEKSKKIS